MAVRPESQPKRLTYSDLLDFPDDGLRRELIHGEVHVTASPNTRHQTIAGRLYFDLEGHVRRHGGGRVFIAPYDVYFAPEDVVEPDLIFVSDAEVRIITEAHIRGVPTLVIEILSDPRRDRVVKRDLYAAFGVPEYWLFDPDADRVEIYRLRDGTYGKPEILEPGETLTTPLIPGLRIDLTEILARDP
jgi:Uma2 family endonuclease